MSMHANDRARLSATAPELHYQLSGDLRSGGCCPNHVSLPVRTRAAYQFFFSSRRRHTRFDCDWSSDVCSSDLGTLLPAMTAPDGRIVSTGLAAEHAAALISGLESEIAKVIVGQHTLIRRLLTGLFAAIPFATEIGRASCRERVEIAEVALRGEE